MHTTASMKFPEEVLASTQLSAERLVERATLETALALYREGRLSSGLAAKWVGELWATPRTCSFLAGLEMLTGFGGSTVYPATIVT